MLFLAIEFFTLGLFLFIYTRCVEPNRRRVTRYETKIGKTLPHSIKILHLSDTHFANRDPVFFQFFDSLALEEIDLVVVSGDIMDCREGVTYCVDNLKKLRPRYGTYAVFGNHDYYDYSLWDVFSHNSPGHGHPLAVQPTHLFQTEMEKAGIHVLRNQTAKIDLGETQILIHGLDDPTTGRANVRKAMSFFDKKKINILLTHSIDAFFDIGENEIDLAFSGHSHGGQICLPFIGPLVFHTMIGRQYVAGLKKLKGAVCSISRGLGASRFFNFRLLSPPEAIILKVEGKA